MRTATFTALYDACVLYPAPLRDLLMHLALTDRKDFPPSSLSPYGIEAQHPDEFILHLLDLLGISETKVLGAVRDQRRSLKNPPRTAEELLSTLEQQGLFQTVTAMRHFAALL